MTLPGFLLRPVIDAETAALAAASFDLRTTSSALLLACREDGKPWIYNPPPSLRITPGLVMILMGSPEDMAAVRKLVG